MTSDSHAILCCGIFAIDIDGHRLLRKDVPLPLEPKAFAVLALLASGPGRVFGRDEILDAVWGHRHVTPGVLNRVITMLRHALDEDASRPRYLHTVYGFGYRLDLPRRPPDADSASPDAAPDPSAPLARAPYGGRRASDAPASGDSATGASAGTLVVLPLRSIGGDLRVAVLADGLTEELTTTLARVPALRVTARTSAMLAAAENSDLTTIGVRLGVGAALEGSVRGSGERLRVSLRLVDVASGRTRWAQDYDQAIGDLLVLESEIAQAVSLALQRHQDPDREATATPTDPKRYLRYSHARMLLRGESRDLHKATLLFRKLVAQNPDDARAHEGLADALFFSGYSAPSDVAAASREAAMLEARRALALDPDLASPHAVLSYSECLAAQWDQCLALLHRAVELAPSASRWRATYAWRLATLGYLRQGLEQADRAIAADPLQNTPRRVAAQILDVLGEHELAHQQLCASRDWQPTVEAWFNAALRQQYDEAMELAGAYRVAHWRAGYLAVTEALRRPALWPRAYAAIKASEKGRPDGGRNWSRLLAPEAEIGLNLRMLEGDRRQAISMLPLWIWAPELAAHRRDPSFQGYLQRNHIIDYWQAHGWPEQCHPAGDTSAVCA